MKKLLSTFGVFTLLFTYANAYDVTNGPLQQDQSLCSYGYNSNCSQSNIAPNQKNKRIIINIPSKYGALAANQKTGTFGGFLNGKSKAEAIREAIKNCEDGGKNSPCKIVSWVRNGCIAGASGRRGNKWPMFFAGSEKGQTEAKVLAQCKASGIDDCKIIVPEGCALP